MFCGFVGCHKGRCIDSILATFSKYGLEKYLNIGFGKNISKVDSDLPRLDATKLRRRRFHSQGKTDNRNEYRQYTSVYISTIFISFIKLNFINNTRYMIWKNKFLIRTRFRHVSVFVVGPKPSGHPFHDKPSHEISFSLPLAPPPSTPGQNSSAIGWWPEGVGVWSPS